jgi:hypothetical protein
VSSFVEIFMTLGDSMDRDLEDLARSPISSLNGERFSNRHYRKTRFNDTSIFNEKTESSLFNSEFYDKNEHPDRAIDDVENDDELEDDMNSQLLEAEETRMRDLIDARFGFKRLEHATESRLGWLVNMHASVVPESTNLSAAIPYSHELFPGNFGEPREQLFYSEDGSVSPGHASVDFYFLQEVSESSMIST